MVFSIIVFHLSVWISCSHLLCFGVIWCFHLSPFVVAAGVGGVGAAATIILAIAMVFLKSLQNWTIFVLFLCSWNLPPTKKEHTAVFYSGLAMLAFIVIAQF